MTARIETAASFTDDPKGQAQRWQAELDAAKKWFAKFHERGDKVLKRYLDDREAGEAGDSRLNLLWSDTQTKRALYYGKVPRVSVSRRFADSADDVARVAGEMLERLLNTDVERDSDSYREALEQCLDDRLLPGLGFLRCRYTVEMGQGKPTPAKVDPETGAELAPEVPAQEVKQWEDVETRWVYWKDLLWSPCRVFGEMRWWAEKVPMTRDDLVARFGEDVGRRVPLTSKHDASDPDAQAADPWARAEVWEIWDKERKKIWWYVEGYPEVLEVKADILGLDRFWPFPRPMIANATTSAYIAKPDFTFAQDLYNEIDTLETRIAALTKSVKVAGVYDNSSPALGRMLEQCDGKLVPVENWAMFAEKGGIKGQVDFFPLDMVVGALDKLTSKLAEKQALLYQVTGMSDIMRGQAAASATATEQSIKAKFGGVRVETGQNEFARFASDAQKVRAEIIAKHFDAKTIIERSNIMRTTDAHLAEQAAALIKDDFESFRIEVKPENVSLTDYAALRQERGEVVQAVSGYLQASIPLMQTQPAATPYLLEVLKWLVAGVKGSSSIEGVLDQAIEAAQKAATQPKPPPPPDPKLEALKAKGQIDMQKGQMDIAGKRVDLQAKMMGAQADMAKTRLEMQQTAQKAALAPQLAEAEPNRMWGRNAGLVEGGKLP